MKKFITLLLTLVLLSASLVACQNDSNPEEKTPDTTKHEDKKTAFIGTAEEVLDAVIAKAAELDPDDEYGVGTIASTNVPVDEDSCTDILGLTTEEFAEKVEEAVELKPDGSWFNNSVVIIKAKSGVDMEELANKIVMNTRPDRFGCLKAEMVVGSYAGEYICLAVYNEETCEYILSAFAELSELKPVRIDRENDWSGGAFFG